MKITEFANKNGVTAKMLRHYDEIGLFSPKSIDKENHYRLYSIDQCTELQWILTLKNLDFSLHEIKEILSGPVDSAKLVMALSKKQIDIMETLKTTLTKSYQIKHLMNIVEKEGFSMNKTINLSQTMTTEIKNQIPTLDQILEHAKELLSAVAEGTEYGFLKIDLRQFTAINQNDGYDVGDRVIVALYQTLKEVANTLNLKHSIARAGGDEFVIYAEGSKETLKQLAYAIKEHINQLDYTAIGCHKPIDVYLGGVTNANQKENHLKDQIDETENFIKAAHKEIQEGGLGICINK